MGMRARRTIASAGALIAAGVSIAGCSACPTVNEPVTVTADPSGELAVGQEVSLTRSYVEKTLDEKNRNISTTVWWDLDGDGVSDLSANHSSSSATRRSETLATVTTLFDQPGIHRVSTWHQSRSNDGPDSTGRGELSLTVNPRPGEPPFPGLVASFTAMPNPARPNRPIALNASASTPSTPGGQIVRYQWDLDFTPGNFEFDTGGTPTTTHSYEHEGTYTIGLRVTDDTGAQATATRAIVVDAGAIATSARTLLSRTQGSGAVFRFRPQFPEQIGAAPDSLLSPDGSFTILDQAVRGRIPVKLLPGRLRQGARSAPWVGRFNITRFVDGGAKFAGVALARVPAGGLACLGVRATAPASGEGVGGLRVLGGTRSASALRGALAGTARLRDGEVTLQGRNHMRLSFRARGGLGSGDCADLRPRIVKRP